MKSLKALFLTIVGDIKLQWWPPFLYYSPGDYYKISGTKTRDAMKRIRPGDLVLRGYRNYLDGMFIPGSYTHTGIYVGNGKIIHAVAEGVSEIDVVDFLRADRFIVLRPKDYKVAAIQRAKRWLREKTPYDFNFKSGNPALYCHELGAEAYSELKVEKMFPYMFGIKFRWMKKVFLAESFLSNKNFRKIVES